MFSDMFEFLQHFFDDLIAHLGGTFREHIEIVRKVLTRCREARLQLNLAKSRIGQLQLDVLGHLVSYNKIGLPSKALDTIQRIITPSSVKSLQQFLGFASYYRTSGNRNLAM